MKLQYFTQWRELHRWLMWKKILPKRCLVVQTGQTLSTMLKTKKNLVKPVYTYFQTNGCKNFRFNWSLKVVKIYSAFLLISNYEEADTRLIFQAGMTNEATVLFEPEILHVKSLVRTYWNLVYHLVGPWIVLMKMQNWEATEGRASIVKGEKSWSIDGGWACKNPVGVCLCDSPIETV